MRLIDGDKLLEMRFTEGIIDGGELLVSFNDVVSAIRQAPTVEGYRKASDVAREIIGEILSNNTPDIDGFFTMHVTDLAELKKKYTKEWRRNGNERNDLFC